jgi:hypothetical protein
MLAPESLDGGSLGQVPNTDGLVFTTRYDLFVFRVEEGGGHIIEMSMARVDFPGFGFAHPPDFNGSIIRPTR